MVYVAVLFARRDSNYKALSGVDVWDEDRDARNYVGQYPVVAHPPCRAFSQLRHFAKPMPHEKSLAFFAIEMIRKCGGVLEHPARSTLWGEANLPLPGERDMYGGWTYEAPQRWWGHKCEKPTRFYIVGCSPENIPDVPLVLGEATHVMTYSHKCRARPQVTTNTEQICMFCHV